MNRARLLLVALLGLVLAACTGPTVDSLRDPVPEPLVSRTAVPGYSHIRYWGDDGEGITSAMLEEIAAQQKAAGLSPTVRNFLSISGGGSNGAFGAGLLSGWTKTGTRPEFTIVTGVSTGSLIAPFAYLGPPYDELLTEAYTQISGQDVFRRKHVLRIIGSASAADNTPLRQLVARYVTDRMVADIAVQNNRGRKLLVGTTNLDAGRPVVWDIGAIAASGVPGAKQLIQDILVASSSIPGVFPPVKIKVVADGQTFDEMHVDGGTSNQAFLFPSNFSVKAQDIKLKRSGIKRTLFVIRNGKVSQDYQMVKPRLAAIVGRSISTLITTQGIGDLYRMYTNAMRDGIAFRAIWVPDSFTMEEPEPFDPAYMKALYKVGFEMGRTGIPWATQPP
ncbi:patatin-like phospholipase family protein [Aestuariivirga litoralis]|uniref:patatin-like phospholipase family protein n=1 Tax=Aestuariivirga litoralis TaxID=2650924 RepID=UPI0011B4CFF7|nr:patatin-like phospholipase family protein [Aestuariivirga litoralis]